VENLNPEEGQNSKIAGVEDVNMEKN